MIDSNYVDNDYYVEIWPNDSEEFLVHVGWCEKSPKKTEMHHIGSCRSDTDAIHKANKKFGKSNAKRCPVCCGGDQIL